jgi:hypothetical protein
MLYLEEENTPLPKEISGFSFFFLKGKKKKHKGEKHVFCNLHCRLIYYFGGKDNKFCVGFNGQS